MVKKQGKSILELEIEKAIADNINSQRELLEQQMKEKQTLMEKYLTEAEAKSGNFDLYYGALFDKESKLPIQGFGNISQDDIKIKHNMDDLLDDQILAKALLDDQILAKALDDLLGSIKINPAIIVSGGTANKEVLDEQINNQLEKDMMVFNTMYSALRNLASKEKLQNDSLDHNSNPKIKIINKNTRAFDFDSFDEEN